MIKEAELAYYRSNIIDKYVIEIMTSLETFERSIKKANEQHYKCCKHCKNIKPLSEFYKNPIKKQGVFDYCKNCAKALAKKRRKLNESKQERKRDTQNAVSA